MSYKKGLFYEFRTEPPKSQRRSWASIARKLTFAIAKSSRKQSPSAPQSPAAYSSSMSSHFCPSPMWSSLSSPGKSTWRSPMRFVEWENLGMMVDYGSQRSSRRSWKPLLDTITEK
ncbi:hypothetical protein C1H46_015803 [Malus baccata]|uniref:Uncharacterized protein n=1 Tax=Malus baccata TaxID=106549 RepID=A0A540MID5_MALBA|nr:hypothetical protein C1H46_015803 [Malus baccata]